ncbi:UNKNOWN [Stylonychia lemnae]|uniref:Uncharacterized protein n=1 Tax=Stylonychia lemnae TaxID=5949 RepID=A0A078ARU4_STYLE|nr:UNKNOWN [Stylonychia lemnae]|eukprot:CDW84894.1 UNKNOWN [Stylonychia lemnae]
MMMIICQSQTKNNQDDDFLPEYLVKDAPSYKRNPVSINLPWLINGAPNIDLKTRFMGEQILSRLKVHKNEILEHLFKIFRAVLLSSQDRDFDFLEQYCEEVFYTKLRNILNEVIQSNFEMIVEEDMFADRDKPIQVEANIYDHTLIKKLSSIRKEIAPKVTIQTIMILKIWTISPKCHSTIILRCLRYITDPKNFADPKVNKEIHKDAHRVIFRAYVEFKTGYKIYLKDKYGKNLFEYPQNLDYTWQHVGVFETLMEPPIRFNKWSQSENVMEWIQKHTFATWKMVDLDNWLVGNPLVIPKFDVKQKMVTQQQAQGL